MTKKRKPSETPYLHIRESDGSLLPFGVEISGNRRALLQLRRQIDRAHSPNIVEGPFCELRAHRVLGSRSEDSPCGGCARLLENLNYRAC